MSSIQLTGLSTGIDTAAIIEKLMAVERNRITLMQYQLSGYEEKQDAITGLEAKVKSFSTALKDLSDADDLRSFKTSTSDSDLLTATSSSSAYEGSYNIKIKQIASANRWVHSGFDYLSEYVGAGNLILSYNDQEFVVQTASDTTLQDLVDKINTDPYNTGVTASILEYDDPAGGRYHLVLSGRESGSDYQISIHTSSTEVHTSTQLLDQYDDEAALSTKISNLSGAADFDSGSTPDAIRIQGTQHDSTAVNVLFEINQNTTLEELLDEIEEAYGDTVRATLDDGKIVITDKTSGLSDLTISLIFEPGTDSSATWTPPTFSVTTEGGSITSGLTSLDPGDFLETQYAKDALIKIDGYPPGDDTDPATWISKSSNTIDDVITGVTLNLQGVTGNDTEGYDTVEVSLNRDTEALTDKMQAMVDAYNSLVTYIDEQTTYDEEEKKSGLLSSEYSLTSMESMLRSVFTLNVSGFTASDPFMNPKDIGLELEADGTLSLDSSAFDEALVDNYLGVLDLLGAQKTGKSDSSIVDFYQASTYTDAGQYDVRVTIEAGVITSAQIKLDSEDWDEARDMTVIDNMLYGSNETGTNGYPANPEYSLALSVDTGQTGTFDVNISIRQGFAGNLYDMVDDMLDDTNGRISISKDSIQDKIDRLNDRIEDEEDRLETVEERLQSKYARLEALLQSIQQQMAGLSML